MGNLARGGFIFLVAIVIGAVPVVAAADPRLGGFAAERGGVQGQLEPNSGADPSVGEIQPVADGDVAADAFTAGRIAAEFGHPVIVSSLTDEVSLTEALPDGRLQLSSSTEPVRVRRGDGWVPVDLALRFDAGGAVVPAAAAVPVELSGGGSGPLLRVQAATGEWLAEGWTLGPLPKPTLLGAVATYAEVLPGVDLSVTATPTGVSEVLVVKSPAAAGNPALANVKLSISSELDVVETPTGATIASDGSAGAAALVSASPTFWDSSAAGSDVAGPGGVGTARPVEATVSDSEVVLDVAGVLDDQDLTYPVFVDPDWSGGQVGYTYVDSAYPGENYWNGSGASDALGHVGYVQVAWSDDGRAHTTRTFWKVGLSGLAGKHIVEARFNTTGQYSSSCTKTPVELWRTDVPSTASTWSAQPRWLIKSDTVSDAFGYSSSCPAHAVGFDATAAVKQAVSGGSTILGLGLRASYEADSLSWKKFRGAATLIVTYNSIPGQPVGRSISGCAFVCSGTVISRDRTPVLTGVTTDADGGNLRYDFEVWSGHSASPTSKISSGSVTVASGVKASWTVPVTLAAEGNYEYRVRAFDGTDFGHVHGGCGGPRCSGIDHDRGGLERSQFLQGQRGRHGGDHHDQICGSGSCVGLHLHHCSDGCGGQLSR